ncbi:MAG TPA: hypothetical protein VH370_09790 [Humisphaera sp.]|jgi:hypothetical protein|nr:hypothetical protein [Humisphaera sp.]
MPVKPYNAARPTNYDQLVDQLELEWRTPDPAAPEPVILEERNSKGEVVHVYVVWSDWGHLSREHRGEVIMDAAERVKTAEEVLKITIAMGLTPDEADRFGVRWR